LLTAEEKRGEEQDGSGTGGVVPLPVIWLSKRQGGWMEEEEDPPPAVAAVARTESFGCEKKSSKVREGAIYDYNTVNQRLLPTNILNGGFSRMRSLPGTAGFDRGNSNRSQSKCVFRPYLR
jgi:hypothetical protein